MKKLGKIKLNILGKALLNEKELNLVRGGIGECTSTCRYVNYGGSLRSDNFFANYTSGIYSDNYDPSQRCRCSCFSVSGTSYDFNSTGQDSYNWDDGAN